jgi:hypothetical protein
MALVIPSARYQEERVRESLSVGGEADVKRKVGQIVPAAGESAIDVPLPPLDGGTMVRRLAFG